MIWRGSGAGTYSQNVSFMHGVSLISGAGTPYGVVNGKPGGCMLTQIVDFSINAQV